MTTATKCAARSKRYRLHPNDYTIRNAINEPWVGGNSLCLPMGRCRGLRKVQQRYEGRSNVPVRLSQAARQSV